MAKRASNGESRYDAEMLSRFCLKIKSEGFVPAADLKAEFGPEAFSQAIAILYRDFRMFREVRRPWGQDGQSVLGYEWADRKFSKSETKKIPPELGFTIEMAQQMRPRYGDYVLVTCHCRWTVPLLGSVPVKDEHGDPTNVFERDQEGNILILRYGLRAMSASALQIIGKEMAAARKIKWSHVSLPATTPVKIVEHGIVTEGGPGKGLRRSEQIADGLPFTLKAMVPTTVIAVDEFIRMVRTAGEFVGLSPGRSAGFGDFVVESVE